MISIIVPVYNIGEYLPRCIESVLNQTMKDYELILINDGSTDNSGEVCKHYCERNEKIKYYEQKNGGVSSARNLGIQKSCGDFLMFLDGDDFYAPDILQIMSDSIGSYDICICGYSLVDSRMREFSSRHIQAYSSLDFRNQFEKYTCLKEKILLNPPFNKLFRRSLISEYFNLDYRMGEDLLFCMDYLKNCKSIKIIENELYYYVFRNGAATKKFQPNRVENEIKLFFFEKQFVESYFLNASIDRINEMYSTAIRDSYVALHGSGQDKESIFEIIGKWGDALRTSGYMDYEKKGILGFANKSIRWQYAYTQHKYGVIKKLIKKLYFLFK